MGWLFNQPNLYMKVDFKIKEIESVEISDKNITDELVRILSSVHAETQKHKVDASEDRIRIACPFCGDSKKDPNKKRGIIYLQTNTYKCWNGGCGRWMPLKDFFEKFNSDLSYHIKEFSIEGFIKQNTTANIAFSIFDVYDIKDKLIPRDSLMKKMGLVEPIYNQQAREYLQSRKLDPNDQRVAVNPRSQDLVFFNMSAAGKVLGLQIRKHKVDLGKSRFLSFSYGDIHERIFKEEVPEGADKVKRISLLYNILRVDLKKKINVFESSINSHHLDNSIASWGTGSIIKLDNSVYYMDDDEAGVSKAKELLKDHHRVFLWTTFKRLNPYYKESNDINDIFKKGFKNPELLEQFTSDNKLDICNL